MIGWDDGWDSAPPWACLPKTYAPNAGAPFHCVVECNRLRMHELIVSCSIYGVVYGFKTSLTAWQLEPCACRAQRALFCRGQRWLYEWCVRVCVACSHDGRSCPCPLLAAVSLPCTPHQCTAFDRFRLLSVYALKHIWLIQALWLVLDCVASLAAAHLAAQNPGLAPKPYQWPPTTWRLPSSQDPREENGVCCHASCFQGSKFDRQTRVFFARLGC